MPPTAIRIAFWTIVVLLGCAQTWFTRHRIFSDGISYLEIARLYTNGDWHAALNAYWSPLYSWVIALYLLVFNPSPYWEVSSLHVINFAAFLGGCWVFERFIAELLRARPASLGPFSPTAVFLMGYSTVLQAGLFMVGMGYVSPDMIAFLLTGLAGWLVLLIARDHMRALCFVALGVTLGLGYLDRTAFAPLALFYILGAAYLVRASLTLTLRHIILFGVSFAIIAAPFVIAVSGKHGSFTIGESGKLNYGWEVDGAPRSTHWQGEPGDIGTPVHPTRMVLKTPVPVYEFGEPVGGSYPPWHDPSYWYEGIKPHFKLQEQIAVAMMNLRTTAVILATTPAFGLLVLTLAAGGFRMIRQTRWPASYWILIVPAVIGIAMYCAVFVDKRYIAGFFGVLWITAFAGAPVPQGWWGKNADAITKALAVVFLLTISYWLKPAIAISVSDLLHWHEGEYNVSAMLASRFAEIGVKPGERIAFVRSGISADWVRMVKARVVVETPTRYDRVGKVLNNIDLNDEYWRHFFQLDAAAREPVYDAFRRAGATIAVTSHIPTEGQALDWKPVLDRNDPRYPRSSGQLLEQAPGFYRWLAK